MNHWMLRLTGLFFLLSLMFSLANRWLAPEIPASIREALRLEVMPNHQSLVVPQNKNPNIHLLSTQNEAQDKPIPKAGSASPAAPALNTGAKKPWLQVGSFSEMSNAQNMQAHLQANGMKAHIEKVQAQDRTYHRVVIGPLQEQETEHYLKELKALQIEARVIHR